MTEELQFEAGDITPEQFMEMVKAATDEQLTQGLQENWDLVLEGIFTGMKDNFEPEKATGFESVVHWKITGGPDGRTDLWQVTIRDQTCEVEKDGSDTPAITLEMSGLDFVKMAGMQVAGPELFMSGRLKVEGDMMLAARIQTFFNIPGAPEGAGTPGTAATAGQATTPETTILSESTGTTEKAETPEPAEPSTEPSE